MSVGCQGAWLRRLVCGLPLLLAGAPGGRAQPLPPPPPGPDPANCVARYGDAGCAARLYAQLLCDHIDRATAPSALEAALQQQYELAGINFRGLSAEAIETRAVRTYCPLFCPQRSQRIRQLFDPPGPQAG